MSDPVARAKELLAARLAAPDLLALLADLVAEVERLRKVVDEIIWIRGDSQGVADFHRNGNVARWTYFTGLTDAIAALVTDKRGEG